MRKIIIIDHESLTSRRKELFVIDELISAGFELEFWDISALTGEDSISGSVEESYLMKFTSQQDVIKSIKKQDIDNTLFILEFIKQWNYRKILKVLTQNGAITAKVELYSTIFTPIRYKSRLKIIFSLRLGRLIKKIAEFLQRVMFKQYCRVNNIDLGYDHFLTSDSRDSRATGLVNHPDWIRIKSLEKREDRSSEVPTKPYVVFVDQFYPLHPDFKWVDVGNLGDARRYQSELNRFFGMIERDLGYKVVIAAHPKADYNADTFEGRDIVKFKSEELIKYSEGVLLHTSLAVSYALFFDKPMALITNSEYSKAEALKRYLGVYSTVLDLPICDTEKHNKVDNELFKKVNSEVRDRLIYSVMTSQGRENLTNADILIEYFKNL